MIEITPERPEDAPAIELLLDDAFGIDRHQKLSYRYRDGINRVWPICLVARNEGRLVGTIRYWPIVIGPDVMPALLLGPVAVEQSLRACGLGGALIRLSLGLAADRDARIVVLVGDEPYYSRFRFGPAAAFGIVMPGENADRVLARSLGALPPGFRGGAIGRSERDLIAAA